MLLAVYPFLCWFPIATQIALSTTLRRLITFDRHCKSTLIAFITCIHFTGKYVWHFTPTRNSLSTCVSILPANVLGNCGYTQTALTTAHSFFTRYDRKCGGTQIALIIPIHINNRCARHVGSTQIALSTCIHVASRCATHCGPTQIAHIPIVRHRSTYVQHGEGTQKNPSMIVHLTGGCARHCEGTKTVISTTFGHLRRCARHCWADYVDLSTTFMHLSRCVRNYSMRLLIWLSAHVSILTVEIEGTLGDFNCSKHMYPSYRQMC